MVDVSGEGVEGLPPAQSGLSVAQMRQRIEETISQRRSDINDSNVREFVRSKASRKTISFAADQGDCAGEDGTGQTALTLLEGGSARTMMQPIERRTQIKLQQIHNSEGPLDRLLIKSDHDSSSLPPGVEERLSVLEEHLRVPTGQFPLSFASRHSRSFFPDNAAQCNSESDAPRRVCEDQEARRSSDEHRKRVGSVAEFLDDEFRSPPDTFLETARKLCFPFDRSLCTETNRRRVPPPIPPSLDQLLLGCVSQNLCTRTRLDPATRSKKGS